MKILVIPPPIFSSADFQFTLKEVFSGSIIILVCSPLGSFLRPPSFLKCHAQNRTQYSSRSHSALGILESSCVLIPMSTLHLSFSQCYNTAQSSWQIPTFSPPLRFEELLTICYFIFCLCDCISLLKDLIDLCCVHSVFKSSSPHCKDPFQFLRQLSELRYHLCNL